MNEIVEHDGGNVSDGPGPRDLHVVLSFTDNYLAPALVTIDSLLKHISDDYRPILHFVYHKVSDKTFEFLDRHIETRRIQSDFGDLGALCAHVHFPREAAVPVIVADVLPSDIDRAIFLDADLMIVDDLGPLWETDLEGKVFGACRDLAISTCGSPRGVKSPEKWGVPPSAPYLNAGVMLIDLAAWRQRDPLDALLDYMRKTGKAADQFHQEALNAVMWQEWKAVPDRWNLIAGLYGRSFGPYSRTGNDDPAVLHFSGSIKPWRIKSDNPIFAAYLAELNRVKAELGEDTDPKTMSLRDRVLTVYDAHFRPYLYPVEHFLWNQRLM
ncbi:MAG: glycosyltransferase family 8 protein [Pseudomonadota bacterium]